MGNCFWCYFKQLFLALAFMKYKNNFNILNIILVQDLCPLKTEMARFLLDFVSMSRTTAVHLLCYKSFY